LAVEYAPHGCARHRHNKHQKGEHPIPSLVAAPAALIDDLRLRHLKHMLRQPEHGLAHRRRRAQIGDFEIGDGNRKEPIEDLRRQKVKGEVETAKSKENSLWRFPANFVRRVGRSLELHLRLSAHFTRLPQTPGERFTVRPTRGPWPAPPRANPAASIAILPGLRS